jgi:ATP-dependent protease HslVU (ClpYQ) peptidase subunit
MRPVRLPTAMRSLYFSRGVAGGAAPTGLAAVFAKRLSVASMALLEVTRNNAKMRRSSKYLNQICRIHIIANKTTELKIK